MPPRLVPVSLGSGGADQTVLSVVVVAVAGADVPIGLMATTDTEMTSPGVMPKRVHERPVANVVQACPPRPGLVVSFNVAT